ncbi:hypothetical protein BROC_01032 [Candidatus Brocadiaceae bacterium]|nr:hypothetical protein BROC_01032 [Candidatus Brocadiaceae bacterium]
MSILSILAIFVLFEEWLWDVLATIALWLSYLLHLKRFDAWLSALNPIPALFAFFIPLIIITPFNLLAIFLLTHGLIIQGVILELIIKLIGTLLIARVFRLTKPALLTFNWFLVIYNTITHLLTWAHDIIHQTAIYQLAVSIKKAIKAKIAYWFS